LPQSARHRLFIFIQSPETGGMLAEEQADPSGQGDMQVFNAAAFPILERQEDHRESALAGKDFRCFLQDLEAGEELRLVLGRDVEPALEHVHVESLAEAAWPRHELALRTLKNIADEQGFIDIPSGWLAEVGELGRAELRDMI
jgi:hypothetical protein